MKESKSRFWSFNICDLVVCISSIAFGIYGAFVDRKAKKAEVDEIKKLGDKLNNESKD